MVQRAKTESVSSSATVADPNATAVVVDSAKADRFDHTYDSFVHETDETARQPRAEN